MSYLIHNKYYYFVRSASLLIFCVMFSAMSSAMCSAKTIADTTLLSSWRAGSYVSAEAIDAWGLNRCFAIEPISDSLFARMKGRSYATGCTIPRTQLCRLRLIHTTAEGRIRLGEMVCNRAIAHDLLSIFRSLYAAHYPIERVTLIDDYGADDERSMTANNSSCFNYRPVAGSHKLSAHSRGMAVDINPLYNPCCRTRRDGRRIIQPAKGRQYADRAVSSPYRIQSGDLLQRLFLAHGFTWGGTWRTVKDYQHFEK